MSSLKTLCPIMSTSSVLWVRTWMYDLWENLIWLLIARTCYRALCGSYSFFMLGYAFTCSKKNTSSMLRKTAAWGKAFFICNHHFCLLSWLTSNSLEEGAHYCFGLFSWPFFYLGREAGYASSLMQVRHPRCNSWSVSIEQTNNFND